MLELLGLSFLLELGHLTSAVLDLALFLLEDFDLVEAGLELLVERVDVAEVRVRGELFLALLKLFFYNLLLMA